MTVKRMMICSVIVLLTSAMVAFAVLQSANVKARTAGDLAGLFTWAEGNCSGRLAEGPVDALEGYRVADLDAYNAGFLDIRSRLLRARDTLGTHATCKLFVDPYRGIVVANSLGSGLWAPTFPEPAWRDHEPAISAPPLPLPLPARSGTGDQSISTSEVAMLKGIIDSSLAKCWRPPSIDGGEVPTVTLRWSLNPDGSLDSEPEVERPRGDSVFRLAAEAAIRAVQQCAPFPLPRDKYAHWKVITWEFDPATMLSDNVASVGQRGLQPTDEQLLAELRALGNKKEEHLRPHSRLPLSFRHGAVRYPLGSNPIAPFTVATKPGANYFIKLVELANEREHLAAFIVGGEPFSTKVTPGFYELRYAVGQDWLDEQEYFGPKTSFFKADKLLEFVIKGDQVVGTRVELILTRGGNLRTVTVGREKF